MADHPLLLVLGFVAVLMLSELFRRRNLARLDREIRRRAKDLGNEHPLMELLDSPPAKIQLSRGSRALIRLNYYLNAANREKLARMEEELPGLRLSDRDLLAAYGALFSHYAAAGDRQAAGACREALGRQLARPDADAARILLLDMDCTLELCSGGGEKLQELERLCRQQPDGDQKAVYQYMLAKGYLSMGRVAQSRELLRQAMENSSRQSDRQRLQALLEQGGTTNVPSNGEKAFGV